MAPCSSCGCTGRHPVRRPRAVALECPRPCWQWDHPHLAKRRLSAPFTGSGYRAASLRGRTIDNAKLADAWRVYDAQMKEAT